MVVVALAELVMAALLPHEAAASMSPIANVPVINFFMANFSLAFAAVRSSAATTTANPDCCPEV